MVVVVTMGAGTMLVRTFWRPRLEELPAAAPRSSGTTEDAADDSNADPHGNDDGDNYPSYDQTHYEAC